MRCLIVDSDQLTIRTVRGVCEARKIKAIEVGCADAAAEAAATRAFHIAFAGTCVTDVRVPEFVRMLQRIDPRMRIVLLSAYPSIAEAVEAVQCGAEQYLSKPVAAGEIDLLLTGASFSAGETRHQLPSLARVEWEYVHRVLNLHKGNVSRTAQVLGIHRQSLQRKLRKYPTRW